MASQMSEEQIYEEARLRVKERKGFWGHFGAWASINIILIIIWALTDLGGYPWFVWPLGIWGVFVLFHFLRVFVFYPDYEKLIPEGGNTVEFSAPLMYQRLGMVGDNSSFSGIVRFLFSKEKNRCDISCQRLDEDAVEYKLNLSAKAKADCRIALNIAYIMEAINPFSLIKAKISSKSDPIVLRGDLEELTIVVMPMFVQ